MDVDDVSARAKCSVGEENDRIKYAVSCMKGHRLQMEDAHTAVLDLDGFSSTSFFGVYDGHGGADVALYCSRQFHIELTKQPDYDNNLSAALQRVYFRIDGKLKQSDEWRRELALPPGTRNSKKWLRTALRVVSRLWKAPYVPPQQEGSTACVALIRGNQIIVGNIGDSRCVLSKNGQANDISADHKPEHQPERERIERAGGQVSRNEIPQRDILGQIVRTDLGIYRVEGQLAVSRAIGDFQFKRNKALSAAEQIVTCSPDIFTVEITDDAEFLIVASDGIWDVKTSQEAVGFVSQQLQSGETDLLAISERLLDSCVGRRPNDNSTVILVQFKAGARIPSLPRANPRVRSSPRNNEIEVVIEGQSSDAPQSSNPPPKDEIPDIGCVGCFGD